MECLVDTRCQVGESPVWDARQDRLFWVDVLAQAVFALDVGSGQIRRWTFDGPVGSLGLTRTGRLVIAIGLGVHLFDPGTEPGFNRSSQHLERGGCDDRSEAALGSVRERRVDLAWSALCCA